MYMCIVHVHILGRSDYVKQLQVHVHVHVYTCMCIHCTATHVYIQAILRMTFDLCITVFIRYIHVHEENVMVGPDKPAMAGQHSFELVNSRCSCASKGYGTWSVCLSVCVGVSL